MMIVRSRPESSRMSSIVCLRPEGSRPEVGSSKISSSGSFMSAAAMPRRVSMPVEKPSIRCEPAVVRSTACNSRASWTLVRSLETPETEPTNCKYWIGVRLRGKLGVVGR